jgi:hypothetical protein
MARAQIHYPRPEFCIDPLKVLGVPLGRLYVPYPWTTKPEFLRLFESVHIYEHKPYGAKAQLIWFIAPISEYRRLVLQYPHSYYGDSTLELLKVASTFFSSFQPRYASDYTDVD